MARLRPLPYREVVRKLNAAGFDEVSRRSSHVKFVKDTPEGVVTAVVPDHREIPVGTLKSILRQARLSADQFESL